MRSIVFEDNRTSLRYWIYTLIITTYCMNKRGNDSLLPPYAFFFLIFYLFFSCNPAGLEPVTFRIPLAYQSLFYTTTRRGSVENYPLKIHFYFTWSLTFQKIYITIYLFIWLTMFQAARKHALDFFNQLGPQWVSFLLRSVHLKTDSMLQE